MSAEHLRWNENMAQNWVADCMHWFGRVLHGERVHWCEDWDGLPVDETSPEWPCGCFESAGVRP